jgi:hypothetical protein
MKRSQVRWAATHDWFISCSYKAEQGWEVTARQNTPDFKGGWVESTKKFTSFMSLKKHAGY